MGRCSYTWKERDEDESEFTKKCCQKETWRGSDEFCIFHDPSPEKDANLFKKMIEEQIETETEEHNFIGYHFPEKWDFFVGKKLEFSANFTNAIFCDAFFNDAIFKGKACFDYSRFMGDVDFTAVEFKEGVSFDFAVFQKAYFKITDFKEYANFISATFQKYVCFWGANFEGSASFLSTKFEDRADFRDFTSCGMNFRGSVFEKKLELVPETAGKIDFRDVEFLFRSKVNTNLKEALYQGAFIENVAFIDCTWPEDCIIYEERHMNDQKINLSYQQLETIYRDLKQNMQNHGDYAIAGEFYYREMEMRRKATSLKNISRWWLEFYRFLAGYGEKPYLVVRNSFLFILLAAVLFFFCGVARVGTELPLQENPDIINYSIHSLSPNTETLRDFGYCLYYSIVTFTTLGYGDIHPLGYSHIVASLEALAGAFSMALFVVVFARKMMR
jgi:uncharacterized protein YjbI with pentapeptide repeats